MTDWLDVEAWGPCCVIHMMNSLSPVKREELWRVDEVSGVGIQEYCTLILKLQPLWLGTKHDNPIVLQVTAEREVELPHFKLNCFFWWEEHKTTIRITSNSHLKWIRENIQFRWYGEDMVRYWERREAKQLDQHVGGTSQADFYSSSQVFSRSNGFSLHSVRFHYEVRKSNFVPCIWQFFRLIHPVKVQPQQTHHMVFMCVGACVSCSCVS